MEDNKNAFRVIVIGLNYGSILTMVRDFGEAGYNVEVVRVFKKKPNPVNLLGTMKPEAASRYVTDHRICIMDKEGETLISLLKEMARPDFKTLLVPVDDFLVSAIDEYYDILKEDYVISNCDNRAGGITKLMDKHIQKDLALQAGLNVPESALIEMKDGECRIPDNVPFPCFIKPNVSSNASKLIMRRFDQRGELWDFLNEHAKEKDLSLLAEEFIDIKAEYSLLGMSVPEMTFAPCIFRAVMRGHRERKGVAVTGMIMDTDDFSEVISKAEAFVSLTGYVGMFDIDLIEDQYGKIYFTELNLRAGASVNAFSRVGFNLPSAFAAYMLKREEPKVEYRSEKGKVFVSEKALLEEYVRSDITRAEFLKNLKEPDLYFIKDDKDPEPFKVFKRYAGLSPVLRLPYGIRDRIFKR